MKPIILLMAFGFIFYSANLFAQTATDLNCTSCVQTSEIQDNAIKSGKINNAAVTSIKISDGTILNADISGTAAIDPSKISGTAWTSSNDGSGSSLEADLLDGLDGAQFLRSDMSGTISGDLTATGNLSGTGVCIGADCRSVWPAEGEESFWEDGGDGGIFYSGGNVGIGNTDPDHALVVGPAGGGRHLVINDIPTARWGFATGNYDLAIQSDRNGSWETKIQITDEGNLGIGTTSPSHELDVTGDVLVSDTLYLMDTHHSMRAVSGEGVYIDTYNVTDPFFIQQDTGNVGIGTTSPNHQLDITGDALVSDTLYLMDTHHSMRAVSGEGVYIDTYNVTDPFFIQQESGNVGIGTTNPGYKLAVEGTIAGRELIITEGDLSADFVFKDNYPLKSLKEVESFIQQNKHLPDIPSEKEVLENGVSLGDMQKRLLQKVEELTLYVIEQNKEIADLKSRINNF